MAGKGKVLAFYHCMDEHGGAAKMYSTASSLWSDMGYDVTIFTQFGEPKSKYTISPKVKIVGTPFKRHYGKVARSLLSPIVFVYFFIYTLKHKPNILVINHSPYYTMIYGLITSKILSIPFIIWKHMGYYGSSSFLYRICRRIAFPFAEAVVHLTEGDTQHSKSYSKKPIYIYNIFDLKEKPPKYDVNKKVALFVGRLTEQKCLEQLIYAWKDSKLSEKDWTLLIVGDGEKASELKLLAANDKSIIFTGATCNINEYYSNAGFFILSSRYEGLPMVLLEAAAYGLPLVSYNCKYGPATVIENNFNGFLVEEQSISELTRAIIKIAGDPDLRLRFSEGSLKVSEKFKSQVIAHKWDSLFSEVLKPVKRNP